MTVDRLTVSPPQLINGTLYVKGMRSNRLYAIDPIRPKVLWHRPVPQVSTFIGADEKRFYLGGEEVSAYDLTTRKIQWSVNVHLGTTYGSQLMTQGRIYHYSNRGLYEIDKKNGQLVRLVRGADQNSLGGSFIVTPNALLTISNLAITAYPIPGKPVQTSQAENSRTGEPTLGVKN